MTNTKLQHIGIKHYTPTTSSQSSTRARFPDTGSSSMYAGRSAIGGVSAREMSLLDQIGEAEISLDLRFVVDSLSDESVLFPTLPGLFPPRLVRKA